MIQAIISWWRHRQRRIDVKILWPICKAQTTSIGDARKVFYVHCMMDTAWRSLPLDDIINEINALK